ncbi:MAG: peptide deformylase [bacterium]|nr:peptide deformylase [bacterium]
MKKILQREERVLRQVAEEIPVEQIATPKIKKVLKEMSDSLQSQDDGVAIAAPQIGHSLRIFTVSGKIFEEGFMKERDKKIARRNGEEVTEEADFTNLSKTVKVKDIVFINPVISKLSKEKVWVPEGCLSVRWLYGKTHRSKKATVEAYDENGKYFKMGGSGLLAQIFQHETDHLNGILFIDHAKEVKEELPPE